MSWSGWAPLTIKPPEDKGGRVAAAALAGATFGGPMGALAGAGAAYLIGDDKPKGKVKLDLAYTPLSWVESENDQGTERIAPKGGTDEVGEGRKREPHNNEETANKVIGLMRFAL